MIKVLVFGSSPSRTIFDRDTQREAEIVAYYARSSLASAFASPPVPDHYSRNQPSSSKRFLIHADLTKQLAAILPGLLDFDILLLDPIDERFPLFVFEDGGICTLSTELKECDFAPSEHKGHVVQSGSDAFFTLWERGWAALIDILTRLNARHKLRINAVYWAERHADGSDYTPSFSASYIAACNHFLERLYRRMAHDLPDTQFLRFPPALFAGENPDPDDPDPAPFRYHDAYYAAARAQLGLDASVQPDADAASAAPTVPDPALSGPADTCPLLARAVVQDGYIHARARAHADLGPVLYAFYLIVDGERCDVRKYATGDCARFAVPKSYTTLEIRAFAETRDGRRYRVREPLSLP